ncbi:DUF2316 family protein, partial [Staphylococcus aureus]|uniref:DUF2316 family protein n=1 Tax=Staphylococcus aureus TaxID=1280 RepID=UPI0011A9B009
MSLNKDQTRITSEHFQPHFQASTLSLQIIPQNLNLTTQHVEKLLPITPPLPIFTHQLQPFIHLLSHLTHLINHNIKPNPQTPQPYTYLKPQ